MGKAMTEVGERGGHAKSIERKSGAIELITMTSCDVFSRFILSNLSMYMGNEGIDTSSMW